MAWSGQQEQALKDVAQWVRNPGRKQVFRLFGFAGSGKSTLALAISEIVKGRVCFGAYTGKAASVMRSKGCSDATTIHSMIYKPKLNEWGGVEFVRNEESPLDGAGLAIIDECSMVEKKIGNDLLSFRSPVLVLGDPAQLPPVSGQGFFTHGEGCEPNVMLTEIHRQAAHNPIIHMATKVRMGEKLALGSYGESRVIERAQLKPDDILASDQLIVGRNATRFAWNRRMREMRKYNADRPQPGEKLVCLRNSYHRGVFNGTIWKLEKIGSAKEFWNIWVRPFDELQGTDVVALRVRKEFFVGREDELSDEDRRKTSEFTFGYALTCHKAQGSQWSNVVVNDESAVFRDDAKRWLYTALTRASEKVTVVN